MDLKGGRVFFLLCCAVIVTSLKIKIDSEVKKCARNMMRDCKLKGFNVQMDEVFARIGGDVAAEEEQRPTTILSIIQNVLASVSSGYTPPKYDQNMRGTSSDVTLLMLIAFAPNFPAPDACFLNAVTVPVAWGVVRNPDGEGLDPADYDLLLSGAKMALSDKCVAGNLKLPVTMNRHRIESLMKMLGDVYSQISKDQREEVVSWYKTIRETNCSRSQKVSDNCKQTAAEPSLLGPFLSDMSEDDINFVSPQELCSFSVSSSFKAAMAKSVQMKPSSARKLLGKIKQCRSQQDLFSSPDSLGPLACYLETSSQPTSADTLKLLSALSKCNNAEQAETKQKWMESVVQNISKANAYETLRQLGGAAKFLRGKMDKVLPLLDKNNLKMLLNDSNINLSKKQKRKMVNKFLDDKKCGELLHEDLDSLTEVADELPNCYYKNLTSTVFDDPELLKKISKKLKKSQGISLLKGLGKMTAKQMVDLPSLARIVPLKKLKGYNMSWDQYTAVTWRPGQAKLLATNMTKEVRDWYRIARSILQGVTCDMIRAVPPPEVQVMAQSLADSSQWLSTGQIRCTAKRLFETLESNRTNYFRTITVEELSVIRSVFLIHLPPEKVMDLPDSVCPVFLDRMQLANLSSLLHNPLSRAALTEKALKCLGPNLWSLTAEDMSKLGPLICEVPPPKLRLLSPSVLRTSFQAMTKCVYIPPNHQKDLVQLVGQTFGDPSTWSVANVDELGSFLVLYEPSSYVLPKKVGMKDAIFQLIQRFKSPPEFLQRMLFELMVTDTTASPPARKRRAATAPLPATPTVALITELGPQNVYWTPEQLTAISNDTFLATAEVLGSVTIYSPEQLAVLSQKATAAYGPPENMAEAQVDALGCVAQGYSGDQLMNMAFPLLALADIARCGWTSTQITAVWRGVAKHNSLSAPTLGAADLVALSSFVCGLSSSEINQLNVAAFTEALGSLDGLKCPIEVIKQFKYLTVTAYGAPSTWAAAEVSDLGIFVAGLTASEFASLNVLVFPHISGNCIPLVPPQNFAALSSDKIVALGPDNAAMVTGIQKAALNQAQLDALATAILGVRVQSISANSAPSLVTPGVAAFTQLLLVLLLTLL